jgi:simple sugar transport system ATP-binding protein
MVADYTHAVRMVKIDKFFGKVQALRGVDFEVGKNEIVGLIGDNGAGKSTITGVFPPTSGELYIRDEKITMSHYDVKQAHRWRIETVYQDKSLADKQDLWRNFFVGRQITGPLGFIKVREEKRIAQDVLMNMIGFRGEGIGVDSKIIKLSGGERQGICIGRAMHFDADLIILDEPTVALSLKEVRKVLNFVHQIKENGRASIYISHNMADVYEISDRFVVLDRGSVVGNIPKKDISLKDLNTFLLEYAHGVREAKAQ